MSNKNIKLENETPLNDEFDNAKTEIFSWCSKSSNSYDFKNKIYNNFEKLFKEFPVNFNKITGKSIQEDSYSISEYFNLNNILFSVLYYNSTYYTRKIVIDGEELIEFISPDFVNNFLTHSESNNYNFIKKTLANNFISNPLEKELSKFTEHKLISQDIRLKDPANIPNTDFIPSTNPDYSYTTLSLSPKTYNNLISLEFDYKNDKGKGSIVLAGNKNAWLKFQNITNTIQPLDITQMENHNVYSVFLSINVSEDTIRNLTPGQTFIANEDNDNKTALIHKGKIIAKGNLVTNKKDVTGIEINKLKIDDSQADYYENCTDNLFIIAGSTYIDEKELQNLKNKQIIMFNTKISGFFPVVYNNKIIAQADIINDSPYAVIKITKIEEHPVDFAK